MVYSMRLTHYYKNPPNPDNAVVNRVCGRIFCLESKILVGMNISNIYIACGTVIDNSNDFHMFADDVTFC